MHSPARGVPTKPNPEKPGFAPALCDFADTAAILATVDLVITADTALAHLADSMGLPTWILLPQNPDWRSGLESETTPWYPAARLFRQPAPGDWASVISIIRTLLL